MKLRVLGCYGGLTENYSVTSFLINDHILLDAGAVASSLSLEEQGRIDAAIISHSHLDHCAGITFLTDNIFADARTPLRIIATVETAHAIQSHLLNGTMWPDFTTIVGMNSSIATIETLEASKPKTVDELTVLPFSVEHTVPTVGFVISDEKGSILYSADTSELGPVIRQATKAKNLKLVIVEASFPNDLCALAEMTGHLVPDRLTPLVSALGRDVPIRLFHMKPRYIARIEKDVLGLSGDIALLKQGEVLDL